jgi:DNA-binding NarL/FixJ family response regulator
VHRLQVALIDVDCWRRRGIGAVLADDGIAVRQYDSFDGFVADTGGEDVILIADEVCRRRERETIGRLRDVVPRARILVFGGFDTPHCAAPLFASGANGCFELSSPPERLPEAVRHVADGKPWGSRDALHAALELKNETPRAAAPAVVRDEFRLLRLLHAGLTNKEIAQRLGLAESTVKARFNRLYRRFGVASRVQLLTAAMRKGILHERD